jgi:RNA polymerase sigma factor (sigma-70 family)
MTPDEFCREFADEARYATKRWGDPLLQGEGFSVALWGALQAYHKWDPAKSSLRTWVINQMKFSLKHAKYAYVRRPDRNPNGLKVRFTYIDKETPKGSIPRDIPIVLGFKGLVTSPDVEERIDEGRMTLEVRQAVKALPRHQRQVIEAYFFKGLDTVKIAKKIGISHQAVTQRINKGLAILKRRLEPK